MGKKEKGQQEHVWGTHGQGQGAVGSRTGGRGGHGGGKWWWGEMEITVLAQ